MTVVGVCKEMPLLVIFDTEKMVRHIEGVSTNFGTTLNSVVRASQLFRTAVCRAPLGEQGQYRSPVP